MKKDTDENVMSKIEPASEVLVKVSRFLRMMEEADINWEDIVCPKPKVKNKERVIKDNYTPARIILGKDFLPPEEVTIACNLTYSQDLFKHFDKTLPDKSVLQWLRDNGFVLIAGPPSPMSLLEIREIYASKITFGYYADEDAKKGEQSYLSSVLVHPEWLMLHKGVVPGSAKEGFMVRWDKQLKLLSSLEYVPNVAEGVWGIATYWTVRKENLISGQFGRTVSVMCGGSILIEGRNNIFIGVDDKPAGNVGILSARKRNL